MPSQTKQLPKRNPDRLLHDARIWDIETYHVMLMPDIGNNQEAVMTYTCSDEDAYTKMKHDVATQTPNTNSTEQS